jgi:hypothetical protein
VIIPYQGREGLSYTHASVNLFRVDNRKGLVGCELPRPLIEAVSNQVLGCPGHLSYGGRWGRRGHDAL